ncbi:hypothetical protein PLICRDRAFT_179013 [Plicaturopsis crispa FD-325 SS-3]|uniref:NmrA-like domain-containing protein n=1 Tax=Plicaturopsis crispa FD-325 SS-3 TaxID=944288 RepID=A0A0C9SYV7_PLICR|nr:hypothetical protein PLICRDRAFT_179013 [Plicaturopsis crispa FD-325 SS-3]
MSSAINIFLTGGTGYIGGGVLARLLVHPKAAQFNIKALVRTKDKAAIVTAKFPAITPIIGSNQDLDVLESAAAEADVVFAVADCDDLPAAEAILRGLKKRHESTGKTPVLIHTSGTGLLADHAAGLYAGEDIYDDADAAQIATLSITRIHRDVDLAVEAADTEGYAKTYIVLPSAVYGLATGPLVDAGFQNRFSMQIPMLIKAGLDRGQGGVVGKGANIWPYVHIDDCQDLYIVLLDAALSGSDKAGHGHQGYYFAENGEHNLYDVSAEIARVLFELGKGQRPSPTVFSDDEVKKYFGGPYIGSNSRARANRSRALGWSPGKANVEVLASSRPEIDAILESGNTTIYAIPKWLMAKYEAGH